MSGRSTSSRELAKQARSKYGSSSAPASKPFNRSSEDVMRMMDKTSSWQGIKAASTQVLVERDPRYKEAVAQTAEAKRMADTVRARVDATRSQVDELAKRAEATRVETERIRSNTEQQRMHTESRMNMARKRFGKRAVAKVERKLNSSANAARSLTDVASMVRMARARF